MSDVVKVAMIAAVALVTAIGIWIYFSPYQSCVRAVQVNIKGRYNDPPNAARAICAQVVR